MTTSNKIITKVIESVIYVPLEALHTENDSINFVYVRTGLNISKQEVQVGETNVNDAIILAGLDDEARLYLSIPQSALEEEVMLLPELNGKRNQPEVAKVTNDKMNQVREGGGRRQPRNDRENSKKKVEVQTAKKSDN